MSLSATLSRWSVYRYLLVYRGRDKGHIGLRRRVEPLQGSTYSVVFVATFVVPIGLALTAGLRVLTETEHRTRSVTTWVKQSHNKMLGELGRLILTDFMDYWIIFGLFGCQVVCVMGVD